MTIQDISFTQTDISGVISLLFDEKEVETIKPEVEVRLGKSEISPSGKPYFNSDVGEKRFNNIIGTITHRKLHINSITVKDTIYYKGRLRHIVSEDGTDIYQHKIKSSDKDIIIVPSFKQINTGITKQEETIRISKAYEKQITKNEWESSTERQDLSVSRERTSFNMEKYTLDLTVKRYSNGKTTFEVEAEFNVDFIDEIVKKGKPGLPDFMVNIKYILNDIFTGIHSLCSSSYFQPIQDKINYFNNKPPELRPKNISDDDIIEVNNSRFAITNKLDGVGYNLIFVEQIVGKTKYIIPIAYNSVDIIRLASIKSENIVDMNTEIINSFSNAEIYFIQDTKTEFSIEVHIFDTLIYGKEKTYTKGLVDRLIISNEISDFCTKNFAKATLTFEVKEFFYGERAHEMNIQATINYMNERYGSDMVKYNDGIIFQPMGPYYITNIRENPPVKESILKWKFPSKVTIDFLLQEFSTLEDGNINYKLYSKTRPETFEIFKDQYTNTEHSITLNKDDYFDGVKADNLVGKVVELGIENGNWAIHRIRFDKGPEKVNHIKTAIVTFVDMMYEFTLPYLVKLFNYTSGRSIIKPEKRKIFSGISSRTSSRPIEIYTKKEVKKEEVVETIKKQIFVVKPKEAVDADIKWLFPSTDRISGQRITDLGLKSITRPKDAKTISDYITKKYYEAFKKDARTAVITDAMAGVGGNTFNFSRNFKKVNAVEIDELTAEILEHNIKLYNIRNYTIFQDTFLNVINNVTQDIIYIDPFAGKGVGKEVFIDGKSLNEIIDNISPYTNMIVLKLSKTVNLSGIIPNSVDDFTYYNLITIIPSEKTKEQKEEIKDDKGIPNLRKLANNIKKKYIDYSKGKTVVDIGSGMGGDMYKYEEVKPKELYFVEPSKSNITEMELRINNSKQFLKHVKPILKYINTGGEDTDKVVKFINNKVDIINMFFSLTFFFKDKFTIESLANTIDKLLGPDGMFIGTTMDLSKIDITNIDNSTFNLKVLKYDKTTALGNEVIIDIKNTRTATYQTEYIVNLEYLRFILATKGIYLLEKFSFENDITSEELELLTPEERLLNSYYYGFIFKREPISITTKDEVVPIKNSIGFINEMWYRFPSPGDGSCFFHSLTKTLFQGNGEEQFALELRDKLADSFTLKDFSKMEYSIILMHQMLQTKLSLSCFSKTPITEEQLKEKIDSIITKNDKVSDIINLNYIIVSELTSIGFDKEEVNEVLKGLYMIAYLQYSSQLKDSSYYVDQPMALFIAKKLNINIIVISSTDMKLYKDAGKFNPDYLSIVLFNIDGLHFEPMYKKVNDNKQYVFELSELKEILS